MADAYLEPEGVLVPSTALELPRAQALAAALGGGRLPYVQLLECRRSSLPAGGSSETIVFEVEPERPQRCVHPIHRRERIAATFRPIDDWYPEVVALRSDFPKVPHLNLRSAEFPRSLCLYEQPWSEIALRWTPTAFIERIRFWLTETAKGQLHQVDQPLEPLLFGSGYKLILPADFYSGGTAADATELKVSLATQAENCRVLFAERGTGAQGLPFAALSFIADPQRHGSIRHAPRNLRELDEFVRPAGISLVERLYEKLSDWNTPELRDKKLLILIAFPLTRDERPVVESTDLWCFLTVSSVAQVGVAIGLWESGGAHGLGRPLVRDPAADGGTIELDVVAPQFDLCRRSAAAASGMTADERAAVAVGVGALGSQVVRILAQAGFGKWFCIDEDILLPHNTARHAQNRRFVGMPKAQATALETQKFYVEAGPPEWAQADLLRPGAEQAKIGQAFSRAELVLDIAASVPVSRHVAHDATTSARRLSLFLNPSGTDLVLLAEDAGRTMPLDVLEMQYYRAVAGDERLTGHLASQPGRLRYARSCRDVSATIPNHLVTLHAAIAAQAVRQTLATDAGAVRVWRADPQTLEVSRVEVEIGAALRTTLDDWTLVLDDRLRERLAMLRTEKLPLETGGVLIGAYDLPRKIVYVVDTIPSPPDSEEWPTLYIRGSRGLSRRVQEIRTATDGQLEYVGEWHSHPDRCDCRPSGDDLKVFDWLTCHMDDDGLPALMAIVGENGATAWFLGKMPKSGGWEV